MGFDSLTDNPFVQLDHLKEGTYNIRNDKPLS